MHRQPCCNPIHLELMCYPDLQFEMLQLVRCPCFGHADRYSFAAAGLGAAYALKTEVFKWPRDFAAACAVVTVHDIGQSVSKEDARCAVHVLGD